MKLRFTPRATQDLAEIADYLLEHSRRLRVAFAPRFLNRSRT
jgi:plasmid stabilization system protein ParE